MWRQDWTVADSNANSNDIDHDTDTNTDTSDSGSDSSDSDQSTTSSLNRKYNLRTSFITSYDSSFTSVSAPVSATKLPLYSCLQSNAKSECTSSGSSSSPTLLDHTCFSHIIDCIFEQAHHGALLALRSACWSWRKRADKLLVEDMTLADVPATQANSNPAVDPVELADKVDLADIVVEVSSERGGRLPSLSFLSDPSLCAAVHTVRYASRARAQDPLLAPPWARGSTIADVACLRNVRTVIDLRGDRDSSHSLGKYTLVAITACQVLVAHPRGPAWAGSAVARVHKSGQARFVLPFGGGPVANMHVGCGTLLALPPGIVPYAICTTRSRIAPYLYKWFLECTLRRVGIALARGHGARRFVFVNVGGGGSTESKGMLRGQVRAGVVEELPSAPVEIVEALVDKVSFMSLEQYAADIGAEQYGLEMKLML